MQLFFCSRSFTVLWNVGVYDDLNVDFFVCRSNFSNPIAALCCYFRVKNNNREKIRNNRCEKTAFKFRFGGVTWWFSLLQFGWISFILILSHHIMLMRAIYFAGEDLLDFQLSEEFLFTFWNYIMTMPVFRWIQSWNDETRLKR